MTMAHTAPAGTLGNRIIRPAWSVAQVLEACRPQVGLDDEINDWRASNFAQIQEEMDTIGFARSVALQYGLPHIWTQLRQRVFRAERNLWLDYGIASHRVVTTAGVNFIVDAFQNTTEVENFKFHGLGTGGTAPAIGDTALVTEITTEYATDNTRPTGTTVEGASANIFRTVGTNTVDGTVAATEHGVFDQAATGGGTLLDRHTFTVINLSASDSIEHTYEITFSAGG